MSRFTKKAFTAVFHLIGPFGNADVRLIWINTAFEGKPLHAANLFQRRGEHKWGGGHGAGSQK